MRTHVINSLIEKARIDKRIVLIVGDLGFNVVEGFQNEFPDRFINCGIAEQNMMSVAAGMALSGDKVFVYSIGNFPTMRCLEQIRNDVCYHGADVNILAVGGGFSYGSLGMTHHSTEELSVLRSLPGMHVYAPADYHEANAVLDEMCNNNGPSYMRLARGKDLVFHDNSVSDVKSLIPYRKYDDAVYDVTIISTGTILEEAIKAEALLSQDGLSARVFSCPQIKPIEDNKIRKLANTSRFLVSVEENSIRGGLGGAISEVLGSMGMHGTLVRFGIKDKYSDQIGDGVYLRRCYGMDAESIVAEIKRRVREQ